MLHLSEVLDFLGIYTDFKTVVGFQESCYMKVPSYEGSWVTFTVTLEGKGKGYACSCSEEVFFPRLIVSLVRILNVLDEGKFCRHEILLKKWWQE